MFSIGTNKKLKRGRIAAFDIPAGQEVCGRECKGCYAIRSQVMYKNVMLKRIRNFIASGSSTFITEASNELSKMEARRNPITRVRIHSSGDFYGQRYINKWVAIAKLHPGVTFYAYTKRLKEFNFRKLKGLPNVVVIDSCKFGPVNFGTDAQVMAWKNKGGFICPALKPKSERGKRKKGYTDTGITCNNGCNYCLTKAAQKSGVVFYKH